MYIWGTSWESAKTQAECYHYLFDVANRMRAVGIDPSKVPVRVDGGIGAATSYAAAAAGDAHQPTHLLAQSGQSDSGCSCCCARSVQVDKATTVSSSSGGSGGGGVGSINVSGFGGSKGVTVQNAAATLENVKPIATERVDLQDVEAVVLDIEGT